MERFPLELSARVSRRDNSSIEFVRECTTSNICAGGVFFSMDNPLPVSTDVNVAIFWHPEMFIAGAETEKKQIKLSGRVVRAEKNGMAISFKNNFRFMSAH